MKIKSRWLLVLWFLSAVALANTTDVGVAALSKESVKKQAHPKDAVVFRFSAFGDSRTALFVPDITPQDKRWHNATPVLARMVAEVGRFHPSSLFFNGDMVMGYTQDRVQLEREYGFWRGLMATLLESGTYVFPAPGNHETQIPTKTADGKAVKLAQVQFEDAWRENMSDLIIDQARWKRINPQLTLSAFDPANAPNAQLDGVQTDQTLLNYSFDIEHVHFAIVNTDGVGADSKASSSWLRRDFEAARARGVNAYVALGHKMAFEYLPEGPNKAEGDGLSMYPAERDAFWQVIEDFHATYFCGHQHVYHASQPLKNQGGSAWQVIVGSGGAPFSVRPGHVVNPTDRMYAWANVEVHASGALDLKIWGFDEFMGPTKMLAKWTIKAGQ